MTCIQGHGDPVERALTCCFTNLKNHRTTEAPSHTYISGAKEVPLTTVNHCCAGIFSTPPKGQGKVRDRDANLANWTFGSKPASESAAADGVLHRRRFAESGGRSKEVQQHRYRLSPAANHLPLSANQSCYRAHAFSSPCMAISTSIERHKLNNGFGEARHHPFPIAMLRQHYQHCCECNHALEPCVQSKTQKRQQQRRITT